MRKRPRPAGPCLGLYCKQPCCVKPRKPYSDEEPSSDEESPGHGAACASEAARPPHPAQRLVEGTARPSPSSYSLAANTATGEAACSNPLQAEVLCGARIMVGQHVRMVGLVGTAALNGMLGRTASWKAESGRFIVEVAGGKKAIKPENLEPAAPRPVPNRGPNPSPAAIDFSNLKGRYVRDDGNETIFPLATEWDPAAHDLRGYVAMEKYDGIRAMWAARRGGL